MTDTFLQRLWYQRSPFAMLLLPLSWLFAMLAGVRRGLFRIGWLPSHQLTIPVVVVGNISVGGTGKTPFVIWLAKTLRERGWTPAIITRGYGGAARNWPQVVTASSDPLLVGDEPVLVADHANCIVVADPDRVRAAQQAIALGATVILSDDGLQHYRLRRDYEIAVIDGARRLGNGWRLPAGPLRESRHRLSEVDALVVNLRRAEAGALRSEFPSASFMRTDIRTARSLLGHERRDLAEFAHARVHAIAGIGNPESFFSALRGHGIVLDERPLRDHAALTASDIRFDDDAPVLMTEKDAVKCKGFADSRCWAVPLEVEVTDGATLVDAIERKLRAMR